MVAVACLVGRAIHLNDGYYTTTGLVLIGVAIVVAAAVTLLPPSERLESLPDAVWIAALVIAIVAQSVMLVKSTPVERSAIAAIGALGLAQACRLRRLRVAIAAVTVTTFCVVASVVSIRAARTPFIDVFVFQQTASARLLHGASPYMPGYPNLYGTHSPFYGPGVLDSNGELTIGLPYPPLSLLLTLPAYVVGGDVRYADVGAVAVAALLMVVFRPGRWTGLVAMVFLLTPRVLFVIERSWTEPVFVCLFALVILCAVRWRRALPYALGLFFATKQYSVLTIPFLAFLVPRDERHDGALRMLTKAVGIAAAITVPFVLWDPRGFWRSVVQFQFMQPLRPDALSYLVWMSARAAQLPLLMWAPFIAFAGVTILLLWRCPRSPAHFAAAATLSSLVFFAFSKQAFCNYYYYVVATACCAAAAAGLPAPQTSEIRAR
jgi:uncharacterized membrane protein